MPLKTVLESYTQAFDQLSQSQDQYGQNFDSLIKQRSADKISHEEFMNQLMAMNQSVVSEKTQDLYKRSATKPRSDYQTIESAGGGQKEMLQVPRLMQA